jgi:hypothetical protein
LCSTISFSSSVVLLSLWHVQCVQPLWSPSFESSNRSNGRCD